MIDQRILDSFLAVRSGFSPDRVVADAQLNEAFLSACRERGVSSIPQDLNRVLLNARKAGNLRGIRTTKQTGFAGEEDYAFASEIGIRFLERRDGVTLDDVICSPLRAAEFDSIASRICPGYSSLQYRWAALNLRKKRRLKPELLARIRPPDRVLNLSVTELALDQIPTEQGLYVFLSSTETLYVGEASNLRNRLGKHLDHSDNKGLAHWIWEYGTGALHVEVQVLPSNTETKVRRAMEAELIRSRYPVFNVKGR